MLDGSPASRDYRTGRPCLATTLMDSREVVNGCLLFCPPPVVTSPIYITHSYTEYTYSHQKREPGVAKSHVTGDYGLVGEGRRARHAAYTSSFFTFCTFLEL